MLAEDFLVWECQYCGVHNEVWVDLTAGNKQDFTEDCRVCCRPNHIILTRDVDDNVFLEARPDDE